MEGLIEQQKDFGNNQEQEDCWNIPYEEIYGDCDEYKVNYANYRQQYDDDSDNDYDDNYDDENSIRMRNQIDEYEMAAEAQAMYDAEFGKPLTKVEPDSPSGFIWDLQEDRSHMEFDEQFIAFCRGIVAMERLCMRNAFDKFVIQHPKYREDIIHNYTFSVAFFNMEIIYETNLRDTAFIHYWVAAKRARFLKPDELFGENNASEQLLRNIQDIQSYQNSFDYFIASYPQYENEQNYFNRIGTLLRMLTDGYCITGQTRITVNEELIRDIITFCSASRKKSARSDL